MSTLCNGCYRTVCVCAKLVPNEPVRKVPLPYPLENQIRHAIQKCAENGGDVQLTLRAAEWKNLHEFIKHRHD